MLHTLLSLLVFISGLCVTDLKQKETLKETKKWVVTENSCLRVFGSTNVNKFRCDIIGYNNPDTISIQSFNQLISLSGEVNLRIANFNCYNILMTRELRKTLQVNNFPNLQIQFISLNSFPEITSKPACITGLVDIKLAGKCKRYNINYELSIDSKNIIHLNGHRAINFSDFGLHPPKKIGGMIAAKDKLIVEFNLNLRSI